jgi:hypothetical protein
MLAEVLAVAAESWPLVAAGAAALLLIGVLLLVWQRQHTWREPVREMSGSSGHWRRSATGWPARSVCARRSGRAGAGRPGGRRVPRVAGPAGRRAGARPRA